MHCRDCDTTAEFVTPNCEDGHGDDCPDLMCVVCGYAVTRVALLMTDEVVLVSAA